jgi:hypothetical protein
MRQRMTDPCMNKPATLLRRFIQESWRSGTHQSLLKKGK